MSEHHGHEHRERHRLRMRLVPRTFRGKIALAIGLLVAVFLGIALALQAMFFSRIYDRSSYRLYQVAQGSTLPAPENGELYVSTTGCYYTNHAVGCGPMTPGSIMEISDADMRKPLMQSAMWFSLALFAAFAVLAMIMAWLISRRLAGRISSLGAQMQRLDPAEPGGRVTLAGSDEVTDLAGDVNTMLERIERAAATQRQFIANASHELRTPIAVIETSLDAPLSQGRFPDDVAPAVRRALDADRNAADLVEGLLALSRVQNMALHHGDAEPPETSLGDAAEHALDVSWDAIEARGLNVHTDIDRSVRVRADETMLALLVGNLVRNAVVHNVECGDIAVIVRAVGGVVGDGTVNGDTADGSTVNGSTLDDGTMDGCAVDGCAELLVENSTETGADGGPVGDETVNDGAAGNNAAHESGDSSDSLDADLPSDSSDLDDLLVPFHRGAASRLENRPGNGLGLSIVKEIADLYHAELRLARPEAGRFAVSVRFCNNHVHVGA
ncbi:sensor histidine kinase [Bifidobacterium myosotis]|uniref:histidine kinase n=1 Tax=Bifidobacterium myosotis TaxID=1630166 RepID=A0A5M9ZIF1_9BIFI|nr:histidine kinase dimerization/phospho-acceptor domain-containing protein [Bifidobacterium myosotis]KAA8827288.1 HAMP domain-containing protein [Bifidobacterium myosotis]